MNFERRPPAFSHPSPGAILNVTVLYENFPCAEHALRLCRRALGQIGPHFHLNVSPWKIDWLRDAKLREEASADVAKAELVIVSWREGASFSDAFHAWLLAVLKRKLRVLVNVIHCDDPERELPPFFRELSLHPGLALSPVHHATPARTE
jgi:hypothetical protein